MDNLGNDASSAAQIVKSMIVPDRQVHRTESNVTDMEVPLLRIVDR
jgi:hypothetical protein